METYTLFVTVNVKPEKRAEFLTLTKAYAEECRNEPGNINFQIYVDEIDENQFVVHESFQTKKSFQKHGSYPHALQWKKDVEPMLSKPREHIRCLNVL